MYSIIAKVVGAVSKPAKETNYKLTVSSIYKNITPSTKLIYIANPNNPTGSYLNKEELRELMLLVPKNIIVVIDGAYAEYVERDDFDSNFSLVAKHENIIMTRTFSKVYGLAGIRLGWCYSSPTVSSILAKVKGPFNTNTFAQSLALIAIEDQGFINTTIKENKINKEWFESELNKIGLKTIQTYTNFTLIETSIEMAVIISNELEKEGILIRQLNSYNLPNCLRISIGNFQDMKKTIKILENLI